MRLVYLLVMTIAWSGSVAAAELRVAVASNFGETMRALVKRFEAGTSHQVRLIIGSTGKHYAQIHNGAPFDAFFAADVARPERLEREGRTVAGSRFTYAVGRLALWSPKENLVDDAGRVLEGRAFRHLAIANPRIAPYGRAARELLVRRNLWATLRERMVRGENIGQAFHFVKSGNAELGLVAWSQIQRPDQPTEGSWWLVPESLHTPIAQQAVLLRDSSAGHALMTFVRSDAARKVIRSFGYGAP